MGRAGSCSPEPLLASDGGPPPPTPPRDVDGHTELGSAHRDALILPLSVGQGKECPDLCTTRLW